MPEEKETEKKSRARLTGHDKLVMAGKVYSMRVKRATFVEISKELGLSRELASNLYHIRAA